MRLLLAVYALIILAVCASVGAQAPYMFSTGVPHTMENIDTLGYPITMGTYIAVGILVGYLALSIALTARYVHEEATRAALNHFSLSFAFIAAAHVLEFFGGLYLYATGSGNVPVLIGGTEVYLYPMLVVAGYVCLGLSALELYLAVSLVRGWEGLRRNWYFIFPAAYMILAGHWANHWGMTSWEGLHIGGLTSLFLLASQIVPIALGIVLYNEKYRAESDPLRRDRLRSLRDGFIIAALALLFLVAYKVVYERPYHWFIVVGEAVELISLLLIYSALVMREPIYTKLRRLLRAGGRLE